MAPDRKTRPRQLMSRERPALLYAIGDVHGCLDELHELEARIVEDGEGTEGAKWIVCLGDYVDRGPHSAGVLDHLIAPAPMGFQRICLSGNHDAAMLAAITTLTGMPDWLSFGGDATLRSYGLSDTQIAALLEPEEAERIRHELLSAYIPGEHVRFLNELAVTFSVPGYVFVHAGLRPGVALNKQREDDLLWIRDEFLNVPYDHGAMVVHGHTPVRAPAVLSYRIGTDTACYMTGKLTALRIDARGSTRFLQTAGW